MSFRKLFLLVLVFCARSAWANVLGPDDQTFNPTSDGIDFVTVHSASTLDPGVVNVGYFLNYAVNSLPFIYLGNNSGGGENRLQFDDRLLSSDFSLGLGVAENMDVGLSIPALLSQQIDDSGQLARFSSTGLTGWRANLKYHFYHGEKWNFAVVPSVDKSLINNSPYTGANPGPTYNLEFVADTMVNDIQLGFNAGYRLRNPGTSLADVYGISPLPSQWIYSMAASYFLTGWDTKLIWELFGSYPAGHTAGENASDRELSSLETLVGLKYDITTNLDFHFGGGTEVYHGTGTPAWRVYTGINYAFGPLWGKKAAAPTITKEEAAKLPKVQNITLTYLRFRFDSTELDPSSYQNLDVVVQMIRNTPNVQKLTIEGHTDSVGRASYNQKLSQARAETVKSYLQSHLQDLQGISYVPVGFGASKPIASNANYQGRAKNRRVVIRVLRKILSKDHPTTEESSITF